MTEEIKNKVYENLKNAKENDAWNPDDGELHGLTAATIAIDMIGCAADMEEYTALEIEPYVKQWLKENIK